MRHMIQHGVHEFWFLTAIEKRLGDIDINLTQLSGEDSDIRMENPTIKAKCWWQSS